MSSFTLSALCAALTCYTPSQLTRQSNSFIGAAGVQRIIAGSAYQIFAQGPSFAADQSWTLSSSTSVINSPTCTYSSEASNNQCTWSDEFTAPSTPGVTISYTAHDSITNRNATFSMITVAAIPQQPSLATSTETQYILTQASSADTCVIVGAPSSYTYEAYDLPATWTGVWADKPSYVRHAVVDSLSRSGLWSSVAQAGEKFDFHAVCYNSIGHSMPYSVYNLVAVASASAPAPTVVSASSVSASSFRVTFQSPATSGQRGFYPDNIPVMSSCTLAYGPSETQVTLDNLSNGENHMFEVESVDLSVNVPYALSCVVSSVASASVQGHIVAVSYGLSSSSGSGYDMSSSSAPIGWLSSSSEAPILLSSSSTEPVLLSSSSSDAPAYLSSSTGAPDISSSTADQPSVSSSTADQDMSSSSESVLLSSSNGAESSSTGAESSSTAADVPTSSPGAESSSSAAAQSSSSTGAVAPGGSSSSSSSANVVPSPIEDTPEGTVAVTFSINVDPANVTAELVDALQSDISSNIAAGYSTPENPLNGTQIEPFVIVTVAGITSAPRRRLLSNSVPVSFIVLGNITSVTGNDPARPFSATAAATSVTTALSTGTFVSTATADLGVEVPLQTVEILPVVPPSRPSSSSSSTGADEASSSTGLVEEDDSSSSGISDGAIAGAVIGSIVGALVMLGLVYIAFRSGMFKKTDAVRQANANDVSNKGPLPITSFEEPNVDMGYTDQPVRIHTDSPLAQPQQSPGTPPEVYSNEANDANDVQVTIETRD